MPRRSVDARWHVVRQRSVTRTAISAHRGRDPLATMEYLNGASSGASVHLLADQRVWHRVDETLYLDMIVNADPGELPFGILVILLWQRLHDRSPIVSNSARRLMPWRRILRPFIHSRATTIAALHSAKEKKVTLRKRPRRRPAQSERLPPRPPCPSAFVAALAQRRRCSASPFCRRCDLLLDRRTASATRCGNRGSRKRQAKLSSDTAPPSHRHSRASLRARRRRFKLMSPHGWPSRATRGRSTVVRPVLQETL
jgi:hypothetical protein